MFRRQKSNGSSILDALRSEIAALRTAIEGLVLDRFHFSKILQKQDSRVQLLENDREYVPSHAHVGNTIIHTGGVAWKPTGTKTGQEIT